MLTYHDELVTTITNNNNNNSDVDSYRSKLSSQLDRLYVSSGSYGSSTLRQLEDGRCLFAHGHVCILWEFQPWERCFQLSTPVYELQEGADDDESNFERLNQLLSQCRKGLRIGHLSWSHDNKLTIQVDLPLSKLEKEQYESFETSMNDFMDSYWKVRSNVAQYAGDSNASSSQCNNPKDQDNILKYEKPLQRNRTGRRFRALRRILPSRRLRKK